MGNSTKNETKQRIMCGITGYLAFHTTAKTVLEGMVGALVHRGPDKQALWHGSIDNSDSTSIGLGHTRLAIMDLTDAGSQPMESHCGRFVCTYNGEIYNHLLLREKLAIEGKEINWRGHSDTETLLAGFEAWGIIETLKQVHGMFAAAVWDKKKKNLVLMRDRMGEKPLYYGWQKETFFFGSELSAIRAHPDFTSEINRDALADFLKHNYLPGSASMYRSVFKVTPGTICIVDPAGRTCEESAYWSTVSEFQKVDKGLSALSEDQLIEKTRQTLGRAVKSQMLSDVPLGAFLSGGTDSSLVAALMMEQSDTPINTFTIGFDNPAYNEAEFARNVAKHIGSSHTSVTVSGQDALNIVPELPTLYAEPFADPSALPTTMLARITREHVTVALSGDAADELFYGYERYEFTKTVWNKFRKIPGPVRAIIAAVVERVPYRFWNKSLTILSERMPRLGNRDLNVDRLLKGAALLHAPNLKSLYHQLNQHWDHSQDLVNGSFAKDITRDLSASIGTGLSDSEWMMAYDLLTYLPDNILVKVDRAAMSISLETRTPFLDQDVMQLAWSLPENVKCRQDEQKWVLKKTLEKYIPKDLIYRPKVGFGVPLDDWLRGPLKEWAEELLSAETLNQHGFLNTSKVRSIWMEHKAGRRNWAYRLWGVLVFTQWYANEIATEVSRSTPIAAKPATSD